MQADSRNAPWRRGWPRALSLMAPADEKRRSIMLASIIALIVVFIVAAFWLRYHKTVPTPSIKGTPTSLQ
jgi:hypothetical protein